MTRTFHLLAALIFAAVSLVHLARLAYGATVLVAGAYAVPLWISWPGMIVAAALSAWAFHLWDLDRRRSTE